MTTHMIRYRRVGWLIDWLIGWLSKWMSEYVNKIINCQRKYMGLVGESDGLVDWVSEGD